MTIEHRHSTRPDRGPANPVWRLQGATKKLVECSVRPTASKLYVVTVALGSETLLDETYPDLPSAMSRAIHIQDRLLKSGVWTASTLAAV
jgi:hypothetical protein